MRESLGRQSIYTVNEYRKFKRLAARECSSVKNNECSVVC